MAPLSARCASACREAARAERQRFLDEPFALQKIQLDRAMALLRDRAYWRTSPLLEVI
jgi:hypothetical protein